MNYLFKCITLLILFSFPAISTEISIENVLRGTSFQTSRFQREPEDRYISRVCYKIEKEFGIYRYQQESEKVFIFRALSRVRQLGISQYQTESDQSFINRVLKSMNKGYNPQQVQRHQTQSY